jgi:quercetin dioxygenase-like cupin family protein
MKQVLYFTITLFATLSTKAMAQDAPIFPKGEKSPNVHHVGNVWLNELSAPDSTFNYSVSVATMERGSRLDWHKHPGGQILLITDGIGFYQEKGKAKQTVRKGDIVKCLPGVEHWHGATPTAGVTYLATSPAQNGKTIWLQKVTDKEYFDQINKLNQSQKK